MTKKDNKKDIFLDKLYWESFLYLFFRKDIKEIFVLDKIKFRNRVFKFLLNLRGVLLIEKDFFVGDLLNYEKKSIYLLAGELVDKLAFEISNKTLKKNNHLDYLNSQYGNNTLRLFIAKTYKPKLIYWIIRGLTSKNFETSNSINTELIIKDPIYFDKVYLKNVIEGLSFKFYSFRFKELVVLKLFLIQNFKFLIKKALNFSLLKKDPIYNVELGSVLSSQEESIRYDQSIRNQYSWYDINKDYKNFNSFVLLNTYYPNSTKTDIKELSSKKNYVLNTKILDFAKRRYRNHHISKLMSKELRVILKILPTKQDISHKYLLIEIMSLLRLSDSLACLCLFLNTKVYLIKEPQYITSDAIQMISSLINVKTICIQYSNKSRPSSTSLSTCDEFLLFSDNYKKVYKTKNIFPKKFIQTGYPLNGIQNKLTPRVNKIKNDLKKRNVSFVIGLFDESIADIDDRWGLIHPKDHLKDIHILAKAVLEDNSLSVLIKNQFVFNNLDKIFPGDLLIKQAQQTNRFISISDGSHRNDIYPMQIGLIADFCISYKFGATAGLECAIAGTRTVLVDKFNFETAHDEIYSKANIIYNDFNKLIEDIYRFRSNQSNFESLGDWSPIIDYFDPFTRTDNNAVRRNFNIIKSHIH